MRIDRMIWFRCTINHVGLGIYEVIRHKREEADEDKGSCGERFNACTEAARCRCVVVNRYTAMAG
jgi:hypothetical protein